MNEKVLNNRKHGMAVMLLIILLNIAAVAGIIYGAVIAENTGNPALVIISIAVLLFAEILIPGLKILKPQEALVLTLFGKYVGTIKGEGFYFVNPFCSSVNPAAKTKLNQSGDVDSSDSFAYELKSALENFSTNRISLKIMTLNNNRQKINASATLWK